MSHSNDLDSLSYLMPNFRTNSFSLFWWSFILANCHFYMLRGHKQNVHEGKNQNAIFVANLFQVLKTN